MPPIWNLQQVLVSLASAGALLWVAILLDRKRSWPAGWSLHLSIPSRDPKPAQFPPCVAVIAARHEAATLPRTLPRLLRQLDHFHRIVIVDDRSEDSTGSTARRLAGSDLDDKVQVVRVDELPDGWASKVNAMHVGIEAATANWDGDHAEQWILLTAADILHPTTSMARMLTKAREHDFDVVSVMAQLRASRFWERLLIPPFVYFSQLLHPFRKASDPQSSVAALAAGCILVRRSTLQDAGGLEAIKDALVDDMALARTLKASGARIWLGIDPDLRSLRTYGSVGEVIDRVSRTAFAALHYRYWALPIAWLGLLLLFIAPPRAGYLWSDSARPDDRGPGAAGVADRHCDRHPGKPAPERRIGICAGDADFGDSLHLHDVGLGLAPLPGQARVARPGGERNPPHLARSGSQR